jgi:GAF domain-containing protein
VHSVTPPGENADDLLVASAVEELGRLSFAEHSLDSLLRHVVGAAARLVSATPIASMTVLRGGHPATVAASDPVAVELDEVQYRRGEGPCIEAAVTGREVLVPDAGADRRWDEFGPVAVERGYGSVLSIPLPAREPVPGGLNLYSTVVGADDERWRLLQRFATSVAVPVSNMFLYQSAVQRIRHLEVALDSRGVIDQAKGILMERFRLTADQAFQALARISMESNVRVRDVAARFVTTGELPED